MVSDELMLKIENVSKIYKLGEIGGTTLRESLQRTKAKLLKREDPTKKIGAKNYNKGEKFKALDNVSFEVKKGERIGIIGHNGAGKSTLLKLISRVTGPTDGNIYLNGRVASMLEVGTGFHGELTGRENIYMNGAILGMTKKEIDAKMEDIIEFSEVRQFIDTPVKRYSSGMYVKLAFSVAAHLDSEIMIMDEVLAVGDVAFQNKCLQKMKDISIQEDKTILYVSHNMNTIKQLCDKVLVLKKGKIIFFGDTKEGIAIYLNNNNSLFNEEFIFLLDSKMNSDKIIMKKVVLLNNKNWIIEKGQKLSFRLFYSSTICEKKAFLRFSIKSSDMVSVATSISESFEILAGNEKHLTFSLDTNLLITGLYHVNLTVFLKDDSGKMVLLSQVMNAISFNITSNQNITDVMPDRDQQFWGSIEYPGLKVLEK